MAAASELRVGILCDSSGVQAWQLRCLEEIGRLPFVTIVAVVVNMGGPRAPAASLASRVWKSLREGSFLWRLYERMVLTRRSSAIKKQQLPQFPNAVELRCTPVPIGRFRESFDDKTLADLKRMDLDVLVRFGFGILTGEILTVARHGLWSYHHGDPLHFRGAPPGFWEIHNQAPVTGVILQRLTEALDGGLILRAGWFKTLHPSYPRSLDQLLFGATHFVAQALTQLHSGTMTESAFETLGPIYRYPKYWAMFVFFARTTIARLKEQLSSLFAHQQWSLGIVPASIEDIFGRAEAGLEFLPEVHWIPEQHGRFLADPFALSSDGETNPCRLLAEEYDWRKGIGQIVELGINPAEAHSGPPQTKSAISSQFHLSYPYLFHDGDTLYCLPECSESNGVSLYRYVPESGKWEITGRLLEGFPAVDPTLFRYKDRYWIFCTNAELGPNELLYAWYADELMGSWAAHRLNPIKLDVRSARPAGLPFPFRDELIRPAQDCSRGYGGGISLSRIISLTPDDFHEELVTTLRPKNSGPYTAGLHTICAAGDRTIVDGARTAFIPAQLGRALLKKLRRTGAVRLG